MCNAADTVGDLGYAQELGNYGEYSGAPNTSETYQYAKTVLECVTANPDGQGRALLIGGGIANFTGGFGDEHQALKRSSINLYIYVFHVTVGPGRSAGIHTRL